MKIIMIVPKVIDRFKSQFNETTNNAYPYFNFDHRVVEERVNRGDQPSTYKGPDQFKDADYTDLINYAKASLNPVLMKYSKTVACEDALHMAIRSFGNGQFDGKVNADKYAVLLKALCGRLEMSGNVGIGTNNPVAHVDIVAKKKKEETPAPAPTPAPEPLSQKTLRELGVKKPTDVPTKTKDTKGPKLERKNLKIFLKEAQMLKNAQKYTERLDKIAEEIQAASPEMAMQIDMISDVLEGRKEATTLKFDADEARYMAGRFNYTVRQRDADEPYMDGFNQNNFEQVITVKRNPVPIKLASAPYKKVQ
jgi:hypothetical protein